MTAPQEAGTHAGGLAPPASAEQSGQATVVRVWDPFIRIFHWSLVALVVAAFLTGDEIEWLHLTAGYGIAALLVVRIVWGFTGPEHARFRSFVKGPRATAAFLAQTLKLKAPRYLGHNPAGAAMILALIATLTALSVTGFLMTTDRYWGSKPLEAIHEALAYGTLALAALHVLGVIIASLEHRENLVRSMLTGRKRA